MSENYFPISVCLNDKGERVATITVPRLVAYMGFDDFGGTSDIRKYELPRLTLFDKHGSFSISGIEEIEALFFFLEKHLNTLRKLKTLESGKES